LRLLCNEYIIIIVYTHFLVGSGSDTSQLRFGGTGRE